MALKLMIFPSTVVRSGLAGALLPWCAPLVLLEPPSLGAEEPGALERAGLVERVKPAGGLGEAGGERGRDIMRLLQEWQDWTRQHAGDGSVEAIKAGVKPPPPPETVRGLAGEIKRFGQGGKDQPAPPPEVTADLMLHLAHVRDRQAAEMEGMLAGVEREHQELGEVMGLNYADSSPADYQETFYQRLPPMSYTLDDQRQLPQRLAAWATLAATLPGEGDAWLATDSLAAVQLLLERANRRLNPLAEGVRSAAGVLMPGPGPMPLPVADSPQAQEAARLVLPGLGRLDEAAMAAATQALEQTGGLEELRAGLGGILNRLAAEPWSAGLKAELEQEAKDLAGRFAALAAQAGLEANGDDRGLSILAFPGLTRAQVMQLMRKDQPEGLPGLEAWPQAWPRGSTPVVVGW